jgi:methionyl-tRNA formyltransferase
VTIMQMDAGLDTGPVLLQRECAIGPRDDTASLLAVLAALGAPALLEALAGLQSGTLVPQPQSGEGVTYASKIDKAEARIDWREAAVGIDRRVRAFRPWPVAETRWRGEQIRVHRAQPVMADANASSPVLPGTILGLREDLLLVACGEGCLGIRELQRAGRRSMGAREFANGLHAAGEVFE